MKLGLVREAFGPQIEAVDAALGAYLDERKDPAEHVAAIKYHFGFGADGKRLASGKRMRAIFCILIGGATGAPAPALRALMLATELMHGASLVHDDLEDGDRIRWGRETVWSRFGVSQAVNIGDAMIGMTYELLLRLADAGTSPDIVVRVLGLYNRAHLRMSEGQHLDLVHERRPDTPIETYLDIIDRKTATACECPSRASAVLAMADPDAEDAFARFGRAFGMLYQVVDDYVGVWGDSEATGKSELGDVVLRKASLPMLYGYQRGSEDLRSRLRQATGSAPPSVEEAVRIRDELTRLGVRELCRQHAVRYRDEAVASLRATRCERPEIGMLETMAVLCAEMSAERG